MTPPALVPLVGVMDVTIGEGARLTVNWSAVEVADTPLGVTTVISNVPAASVGATAVMLVGEMTVKLAASTEPKNTSVAPAKFVPVILTAVPPAELPVLGLIAVTVGGDAGV